MSAAVAGLAVGWILITSSYDGEVHIAKFSSKHLCGESQSIALTGKTLEEIATEARVADLRNKWAMVDCKQKSKHPEKCGIQIESSFGWSCNVPAIGPHEVQITPNATYACPYNIPAATVKYAKCIDAALPEKEEGE